MPSLPNMLDFWLTPSLSLAWDPCPSLSRPWGAEVVGGTVLAHR